MRQLLTLFLAPSLLPLDLCRADVVASATVATPIDGAVYHTGGLPATYVSFIGCNGARAFAHPSFYPGPFSSRQRDRMPEGGAPSPLVASSVSTR